MCPVSVTQAWHGYHTSLPSNYTKPVWLGTHFTKEMREFVNKVADVNPIMFKEGFGARDYTTLDFMGRINNESHLSRCYTLTYSKRKSEPKNGKVFLVNIPTEWEAYIPQELLKDCIRLGHGVRNVEDRALVAQQMIDRYRDEAKLVITCKVHCATPCIASGIPVVVITESAESATRISFLGDIIKINTQDDMKAGKINWAPEPIDIEPLKKLMLDNLRLSVLSAWGEDVDKSELQRIRKSIKEYRA